jgi:hypothetical protein
VNTKKQARAAAAPGPAEIARRFGPAIAPVTISRVPIFAPVDRRPTRETTVAVETPWGRVQVTGHLGQRHRQLLDAAVAAAVAISDAGDGGARILFGAYRVMRLMGSRSWDYRWLEALMSDLRRAEVRIEEVGHAFPLIVTGILTSYGRVPAPLARRRQPRRPGAQVSHRPDAASPELIQITISPAWWAMWADRPVAHYARYLRGIAAMGAVAQAVARLALTQQWGWRMRIDNALRAVGGWDDGHTPSARQRRHHARVSLARDTAALAGLGIQLDGDTLAYTPVSGVWVSVPPDPDPRT